MLSGIGWLRITGHARRYSAAVLLSAAALVLVKFLVPFVGVLYLVPLAAVVLSALYGGIGPGLVSASLCAASDAYLLFEPRFSFAIARPLEPGQLALFVAISVLVTLLSGSLYSTRRRLEQERWRAAWAAGRLSLSQSVTADLASALTQADVARVMLEKGLTAFGAKGATLSVPVSGSQLRVVQSVGHAPDAFGTRPEVSIDAPVPQAEPFHTKQPIWVESPEEICKRYPQLETEARELGDGAWAVVPLLVGERPVGVFTLSFSERRAFTEEERHFIVFLASKYGQAFERARLYEAERAARTTAEVAGSRAGLLISLGAKLNAGRDLSEVLSAASHGARALLGADDAALFLAEPDGRRLVGAFELGAEGRVDALLDLDELPHSRQAVEQREPAYVSRAEAAGAERYWFAKLGLEGALVAPLMSGARCIGILYVDYWHEHFTTSAEDFAFINAIAGLCALALGRAQAYEAEKKSRLRAEAAELEARRIGDLQEQLVAVVSHDLRNPLGSMTMGIDALGKRRFMEPWEEKVLARQARSAKRMEDIIRDLLDFAQARRGGGIPVRPEPVKMEEVCRQVIAELEQASGGRRVSLRVEGDDRGEWDAGRMAQLTSNLVGNALEHSPQGAAVEVRIRGSPRNLVLEVHNPGDPIPPEVVPALFEPFRRGSTGSENGKRNLGLGLFIVREIARAHGGVVDVCSRPGKGTSFAVKLPRWSGRHNS